eukprot:m.208468 g.208468  ORF g.208468 m.208468 type:complete len:86 (+) comp16925_c8_seq3:256-513(+)
MTPTQVNTLLVVVVVVDTQNKSYPRKYKQKHPNNQNPDIQTRNLSTNDKLTHAEAKVKPTQTAHTRAVNEKEKKKKKRKWNNTLP